MKGKGRKYEEKIRKMRFEEKIVKENLHYFFRKIHVKNSQKLTKFTKTHKIPQNAQNSQNFLKITKNIT
jgi:hypothetical protein